MDIKNSTTNKNNSLLELNNNTNYINKNSKNNSNLTNGQTFGNELSLNSVKFSKIKLMNDKNNNNDEENYENQYQALRKDDQIDQNVKLLIFLFD